ncbi:MAG: hypothetical protein NT050_00555, partial [Verrucomicrobia bacterium]|nr:hypothetical protein [Verrucomicrobiota bacterium]
MNFQNLSCFARETRPTGPARTGFAAPKAWLALIMLGCVGLGAMAQTAAPTLGRTADPTADSAAPHSVSVRPPAASLASSSTQLTYKTEAGLSDRPDSEPDVYARERCKLDVYHPVGGPPV